jgi:hypothetical protein
VAKHRKIPGGARTRRLGHSPRSGGQRPARVAVVRCFESTTNPLRRDADCTSCVLPRSSRAAPEKGIVVAEPGTLVIDNAWSECTVATWSVFCALTVDGH